MGNTVWLRTPIEQRVRNHGGRRGRAYANHHKDSKITRNFTVSGEGYPRTANPGRQCGMAWESMIHPMGTTIDARPGAIGYSGTYGGNRASGCYERGEHE